jgi:hypothetical protein
MQFPQRAHSCRRERIQVRRAPIQFCGQPMQFPQRAHSGRRRPIQAPREPMQGVQRADSGNRKLFQTRRAPIQFCSRPRFLRQGADFPVSQPILFRSGRLSPGSEPLFFGSEPLCSGSDQNLPSSSVFQAGSEHVARFSDPVSPRRARVLPSREQVVCAAADFPGAVEPLCSTATRCFPAATSFNLAAGPFSSAGIGFSTRPVALPASRTPP